jgi:phosphotransacetylase
MTQVRMNQMTRVLFVIYSLTEQLAQKKMQEMTKYKQADDVKVVLCTPEDWQEKLEGLQADTVHFVEIIPPVDQPNLLKYYSQLYLVSDFVERIKTHNIGKN